MALQVPNSCSELENILNHKTIGLGLSNNASVTFFQVRLYIINTIAVELLSKIPSVKILFEFVNDVGLARERESSSKKAQREVQINTTTLYVLDKSDVKGRIEALAWLRPWPRRILKYTSKRLITFTF